VYDNPPRTKPMITDAIDSDRLKASSIKENASAAIKTPLPKAIIIAITCFGRLATEAIIEPTSKGILAIKPHNKGSNKARGAGILRSLH
jgi:hypothetical protein